MIVEIVEELFVMIGGRLFARVIDIRVGDGGSRCCAQGELAVEYDLEGDGGSHGCAQSELAAEYDLEGEGGSHGCAQSDFAEEHDSGVGRGLGVSRSGIVGVKRRLLLFWKWALAARRSCLICCLCLTRGVSVVGVGSWLSLGVLSVILSSWGGLL